MLLNEVAVGDLLFCSTYFSKSVTCRNSSYAPVQGNRVWNLAELPHEHCANKAALSSRSRLTKAVREPQVGVSDPNAIPLRSGRNFLPSTERRLDVV